MASAHVWSQSVLVSARLVEVAELLSELQNFQHLTTTVSSLTALSSGEEFAGRGRPLFLRDLLSFKVSSCKVSSQGARTLLTRGCRMRHQNWSLYVRALPLSVRGPLLANTSYVQPSSAFRPLPGWGQQGLQAS
jgi:hypothetical protein